MKSSKANKNTPDPTLMIKVCPLQPLKSKQLENGGVPSPQLLKFCPSPLKLHKNKTTNRERKKSFESRKQRH